MHDLQKNISRSAAHDGRLIERVLRKGQCSLAFSLVEMLMALLVASLLMVALAPVMTKKFNETISIGGGNQFVHEVAYGSSYCPVGAEPKTYDDGTEYCEGEFTVPMGVNKIEVTLVGAGGGGAAAATAGLWEKKEAGTEDFKVPQLVNQLEVTLVGGGAGGGAGGQTLKNVTFVTNGKGGVTTEDEKNIVEEFSSGEKIWTVPEAVKGKYGTMTACGGGGGGGGGATNYLGGGGGSGGYFEKKPFIFPDLQTLTIRIGGGGGGGSEDGSKGKNGHNWGGGGGGSNTQGLNNIPYLALSPSQGGTYGAGGDGEFGNDTVGNVDRYTSIGGYGAVGGGENGQGNYERESDEGVWYGTNSGGVGQGGAGDGGYSKKNGIYIPTNIGGGSALPMGSGGGGGSYLAGGGGGGSGVANGGGGGGPTWIMEIDSSYNAVAPGGGGGAGGSGRTIANSGGGGGGGGGKGGGTGGSSVYRSLAQGGTGGTPGGGDGAATVAGIAGLIVDGEKQPTIFGDGYCNGGAAGNNFTVGADGKDGAMKLTYLDYGPGGSGGGAGSILPLYQIPVTAWETLTVEVSDGGKGQEAGTGIDSNGNIDEPGKGGYFGNAAGRAFSSNIKRNGSLVHAGPAQAEPGCPSGITWTGESTQYGDWCGQLGWLAVQSRPGLHTVTAFNSYFYNTMGNAATNVHSNGINIYPAGSTGGDGGWTKLFGKTDHCKPGRGGKTKYTNEDGEQVEFGLDGGDAEGYGGCGGGGGWSMHKSGKGAPGYARVTWNKTYKLNTMDEYEYTNGGSGGGGSAGNAFRYSIKVQGGDVLKYKIGKGGTGGGWTLVEKTVDGVKKSVLEQVQPTNGGMTELTTANNEVLRAGGGLAGAFPLLNTLVERKSSATVKGFDMNAISYGLGGAAPNLCEFVNSKGETESFIDKEKLCTNKAGADGTAAGGGKGADAGFGAGTGGAAGATGGKVAANGSPAVGFGAGGGGAGLADLGTVNATDALANPTVGGNGGDGKIIFRWK